MRFEAYLLTVSVNRTHKIVEASWIVLRFEIERIISELLPWGLKLRESSGSSSHWGIFEYRPPSLHRTPTEGVSRGLR